MPESKVNEITSDLDFKLIQAKASPKRTPGAHSKNESDDKRRVRT
jgi:hypothetical protein